MNPGGHAYHCLRDSAIQVQASPQNFFFSVIA